MSSDPAISSKWTRPDDFIKLERLKQKKKQLAARVKNNNNTKKYLELDENDKSKLWETKLAQKRKNPFAKATDAAKKIKVNAEDEESGTPKANSATTASSSSLLCFVEETPTRPPPAKLALQKFDPIAFAKLLKQSNALAEEEDDMALAAQQKHTKHLPMDWCLKTRVRFFCPTELPSIQLKTSQMASGLTSFVRCIDTQQTEETTLDISDATRFNQCTYYWQHPHMPWVTLYPRNAKENVTQKLGERERKALSEEWNFSFRGLFQLLRARQCPYFYLCANTFTVLFRAAGIGGRAESHALVTPSTRGMRLALSQEGIEYSLPLKLNVDADEEEHREKAEVDVEKKHFDNDDDEEWLENLGVDEHELRRIQSSHARKVQATEMRDDFSDSSIIFIEGVECQGFFSYLLNSKSLISQVGRLAGIPPTLLSPIAFPKATMQHLVPCSKKVRLDGVDYFSIDIKGLLLPTFLPSVFDILKETREMFSCTLASSNNTFAFTKATQKLMESSSPPEKSHQMDKSNGEAVFNQQNLSECGLLPAVVKSICRSGSQAVGLLERVCYQRDQGFAWS